MAINAYTGLMGSGKTYEVVSSVILPAIKAGRDIVTNIHGLNQELIHTHLGKPDDGVEFGKIRLVKNEQVESADFFPEFLDDKFIVNDMTIVKPGDVVAIDEAWRPWGTSSKAVQQHMAFFREHRHCVNGKGVSCDLALVTQDITDIHKLLKNVIEMTFVFTKLKTLGMSGRYRIQMYEGSKLYKTKLTSWSTSTYNKKIFPLYKSYSSETGGGVEKSLDARQNLFKSTAFFFPVLLAITLITVATFYLYDFFHVVPNAKPSSSPQAQSKELTALQSSPSTVSGVPATPSSAPVSAGSIAGSITVAGDTWVVLNYAEGLAIASPSLLYSRGVSAITKDANKSTPAYLTK
ncbi:zonular occludens toxin domain-containing protein [Thiobacillus sp.]|uniref:zonular occludens toxin family protein n=1 Tax=Thiobacillus sp. TaxID=924 RepID=UPI0025EE40DE|nr:zonular occludens toxin domain-containing protein [Thiobacillus sp.]MBT9540264.1 hypothetical protein [Thiobacillus sp.]